MHKRDALRLRAGDRIGYGHSMWTSEIDKKNSYREGVVVAVTPRGGILIKNDYGNETWVPYHHVVDVLDRIPRSPTKH
jgi:hypothetical protein